MRPLLVVALLASLLAQGCVSMGIQCSDGKVNAWAKVKRLGVGVSAKQAEAFATFKQKVCP